MPRARLLDWRPAHRNTLLGLAKVQFSSGLIIEEIAVHRHGNRAWAQPPARPRIDNNTLVMDGNRPRYQPIISFANQGVRASWSRQVIRAIREVHPDLLPDDENGPALP